MANETQKQELEAAIARDEPFGPSDSEAPKLEIPARLLLEMMCGTPKADPGVQRLWLRNVHIIDVLALEAQQINLRLLFEHCQFDRLLNLRQARGSDIRLVDCQLKEDFFAEQLELHWNLLLDRTVAEKGLSLAGAKIHGNLTLIAAELRNEGTERDAVGVALRADGADIAGDMFCDGLATIGDIRLIGARIGGQLSMNGATLKGTKKEDGSRRSALSADGVEVIGGIFCRENFAAAGEVRLLNAKIGGQLSMEGAMLDASGGEGDSTPALNASGAEIAGDVFCRSGFSAIGEVRLSGVRIGGQLSVNEAAMEGAKKKDGSRGLALNASGAKVDRGLFSRALETTGELRLLNAKIGMQTALSGAKLNGGTDEDGVTGTALDASGTEVVGNFVCRGDFGSTGEVRLVGTRISGQLSMSGATLNGGEGKAGTTGIALNGDGIKVSRGMFCGNGFNATGEVRLLNAEIGGQLSMKGAKLSSGEGGGAAVPGSTLSADGIEVGGDLFCQELSAKGQIRLLGAKIRGQFSMDGATLDGGMREDGVLPEFALSADFADVKESMFCGQGFSAVGELQLSAVKIGGQLSMIGATLTTGGAKPGTCLTLVAAEIDELIFAFDEVDGALNLCNARVRSYWDAEDGQFAGRHPARLRLDGFQYESLREPLDAKQRLDWIKSSQQERHYPGVYAELANAFRRIGHRSDARRIGIANERRARADLPKWSPRRLWHDFLWLTVGYGYRNWRAALWLAVVIAAGSVIFSLSENSFAPANLLAPSFEPIIYAIDTIIPVLELSQTRWWSATGCMAWLELALAFLGYALVAAVIAAAAGLFNRDQI